MPNPDLRTILAGVAAAGAAGLALYGFLIEPTRIEVTHHDLPVSDLPREWEGRRVVQLSDLHYGDPRSDWVFRRAVEIANALEPDLVVLTGDYIMEHAHEAGPALRHLSGLRSRFGAVAILGDHDFNLQTKALTPGVVEGMSEAGIPVLRNRGITLPGGLRLAGTDPETNRVRRADLRAALDDLGAMPHLLLSHNPDMILQAETMGVPMILAGHTHGGQVVVPGYGPPITHSVTGRAHASGWSSRGGTTMYTSRGLASHYSIRFLCRPEVPVFRLRRCG